MEVYHRHLSLVSSVEKQSLHHEIQQAIKYSLDSKALLGMSNTGDSEQYSMR